jgi:hypothetical protein
VVDCPANIDDPVLTNQTEVECFERFLAAALRNGIPPKQIGVLSPFKGH